MNTEKAHERFWEAMRARFGKRWFEEFGDKPTAPWVQLINQHTPVQLRKALEVMGQEKLQHPPTLSQFERFLQRATNQAPAQEINWTRGYWRALILASLTDGLRQAERGVTEEQVREYLIARKATVGAWLRELLDELCDLESAHEGQRTPGMYVRLEERVRQILASQQRQVAA